MWNHILLSFFFCLLEILNFVLLTYQKIWFAFVSYAKTERPTEEHFAGYFNMLKHERSLKISTIWSHYSIVNSYQKRFSGKTLQTLYPRLTMLLKKYGEDYVRKTAEVFSLDQLHTFLKKEIFGPYYLLAKCFACLAWSGGMRSEEWHILLRKDLSLKDSGYIVEFSRVKQRGELHSTPILVPI